MKKTIVSAIKFVTAGFLIWFLIHTSKLDLHLLADILHSPSQLAITLCIYALVILASTWRWYLLNVAQNINLTLSQTILPSYLGIAFNNVLPGGIGGDFFRFYFVNKRTRVKKSAIMMTILFDRITGLLGIFIAVCAIALFQLPIFLHEKITWYFIVFCLLTCLSGLIVFFASILLPTKLGLTEKLSQRFFEKKWLATVLSILDTIKMYRHAKLAIIKCLLISTLIQGLIALTCLFIAKMMGFPSIPFTYCIMAIGITQIVNLIPISPGGFGMGEMAFANVLSLLNPAIGASYATIFLAYRILGICLYLPGICVFLLDKRFFTVKNQLQDESVA